MHEGRLFANGAVSGHGWATPRRQNADVCAAYITELSAHAAWAEKLEEHRRSSFFTPSVCLLSSPGNGNIVSAKSPLQQKSSEFQVNL